MGEAWLSADGLSRQHSQLYLQPLTAPLEPVGGSRQLTFEDWRNSDPAWTPDGRHIVYPAGPEHCSRLWRIDLGPSGMPQPLTFSSFTGASSV